MKYFNEELNSIAKSIESNIIKYSIIENSLWIVLFLFIVIFLSTVFFQNSPLLFYISSILIMISYIGLIFVNSLKNRIFNNMREKTFFYLFYSWKYHNDEKSKRILKKCINELDIDLENYKELAYTENIFSTLDALRDTLIYHIYPKLCIRGDIENQEDLAKKTSSWNEFKLLSIDIYQNVPIESINERVANLQKLFERNETIKLEDENKSINLVKIFANWNFDMYKNSLSYRFIFYLLLTGVIDYFIITQNLSNIDTILPATILIPIMAPYYLAPKQ